MVGGSWRRWLLGAAGLAAFFGLWQFLAIGPLANSTAFPYADATLRKLVGLVGDGDFWRAAGETLRNTLIGFGVAAILGVLIGLLAGLSSYVYSFIRIVVEALRPIPPIVVVPIFVFLFGPTAEMARYLVILGVTPSLIFITYAGVRDLDPIAEDTAMSYRMGPVARTFRVVLPSSMPFVITGLRIAAFASLLTVVMSEIVGGTPGLGAEINIARRANMPTKMYAIVLAIGILGFLFDSAVTALQRYLLSWHVSVRGTSHHKVRVRRFQPARLLRFLDRPIDRVDRALLSAGVGGTRRPNAVVLRVLTVLGPVLVLAYWWWASNRSDSAFVVPLQDVLKEFRETWLGGGFLSDGLPSLRNLILGFGLGTLAGLVIGVALALIPVFGELAEPVLALFRSIPGVAFVPIFITLLGLGSSMRVVTIAVVCSFPVMIAAVDGVRSVNPKLRDVANAYQFSRAKRVRWIELPGASPRIAAGLEIALATALVVMIASELQGVNDGIGATITEANDNFNYAGVWAGVLLLALLGLLTNWIFKAAEHRWLAWYRGANAASRSR